MTQKEFDALVVEENEKLARVVEAEGESIAKIEESIKECNSRIASWREILENLKIDKRRCQERQETAGRQKRIKLAKANAELEPNECITMHDAHQIRKKMIEAVKKAVSGIPGVDAEKVNVNFEFLENGNCDWEVTLD